MKKIILLLAFCFLGGSLKSQSFDPYQLVDGRMPIFDNLFNNLQSSPNLNSVITEGFYNTLFSERGNNFYSPQAPANPPFTNLAKVDKVKGKEVTAYKHFKTAVNYMFTKGGIYSKIFNEGSAEDIKRELAAVAAHVWQETRGFSFNSEQGYHPLYDTYAYGGYHGRGPKQISYDFNYQSFNNFLFGTGNNVLMNGGKYVNPVDNQQYNIGPGALAVDGRLAWLAAFWFYLTPQSPKPSMHDVIIAAPGTLINGKPVGFGMTTLIINGGVECGKPNETEKSLNRIGYYNSFLTILGVTDNRQKTCKDMGPFSKLAFDIGGLQKSSFEDWAVYPNPTVGSLKVRFPSKYKIANIEVYDYLGKLLFTKEIVSDQEFSIREIPNGNYYMKVKEKETNNVIYSKVVIKN